MLNQSVVWAVVCGMGTLVVGYALCGRYTRALGSDAATVAAGTSYLRWYLPGLAMQFALVSMAGRPMGVAGAGLASSLAIAVGVVATLVYFIKLEHLHGHQAFWRGGPSRLRHRLASYAIHVPSGHGGGVLGGADGRPEHGGRTSRPGPRHRIISWNFVASGLGFTCGGMFQVLGNTLPSLVASATRLLTFAVPVFWMSHRPGFRIQHVWYLSVVTMTMQTLGTLWLLRGELRRKEALVSTARVAA